MQSRKLPRTCKIKFQIQKQTEKVIQVPNSKVKKHKTVKKLNKKNKSKIQKHQYEETEDGQFLEQQFSVAEYINMLSKAQRQKFKKQNPLLPAIFFMTQKQKKKYFRELNQNFQRQLEKIASRGCKSKKKSKFEQSFGIKPFCDKAKVIQIKNTVEIKQNYQNDVHFS